MLQSWHTEKETKYWPKAKDFQEVKSRQSKPRTETKSSLKMMDISESNLIPIQHIVPFCTFREVHEVRNGPSEGYCWWSFYHLWL